MVNAEKTRRSHDFDHSSIVHIPFRGSVARSFLPLRWLTIPQYSFKSITEFITILWITFFDQCFALYFINQRTKLIGINFFGTIYQLEHKRHEIYYNMRYFSEKIIKIMHFCAYITICRVILCTIHMEQNNFSEISRSFFPTKIAHHILVVSCTINYLFLI